MEEWKEKFSLPKRLRGVHNQIWEELAPLHLVTDSIDLWKGCPDYAPLKEITTVLTEVSSNGDPYMHQYTKGCGHSRLVMALSKLYSNLLKKEVHPYDGILVTAGTYAAVYNAVFGTIIDGDEVIIIQPSSGFYESIVRMAGGIPKFVPLRLVRRSNLMSSNDWVLDNTELEHLFNEKTKMIIVSTPNYHLGKIFKKEELELISNLCHKWNVLCIADESEEFLVYETEFIRMATISDMWQRTITVGSADSTFCLKGWKVAWAYGPINLIQNLQIVHLNSVFVGPTMVQEALAIILEVELQRMNTNQCYLNKIVKDMDQKRKFIIDTLSTNGMNPIIPDSGIFVIADWSPIEKTIKLHSKKEDFDFSNWLSQNGGVQTVPLDIFFCEEFKPVAKNLIKLCFSKKETTLQSAKDRLDDFFQNLKKKNII